MYNFLHIYALVCVGRQHNTTINYPKLLWLQLDKLWRGQWGMNEWPFQGTIKAAQPPRFWTFPRDRPQLLLAHSECVAAHLVQHDDGLSGSAGDVENVRLLRVQDGELQLCIFSQVRVGGGETAHLHTWCSQLRHGERPCTCSAKRGGGGGHNEWSSLRAGTECSWGRCLAPFGLKTKLALR